MTAQAEPARGTLETYKWKDGRTVTYRARVRAYGRRYRLDFGTNHQGWAGAGSRRAGANLRPDRARHLGAAGNVAGAGHDRPQRDGARHAFAVVGAAQP
jgi:hypothetical protein